MKSNQFSLLLSAAAVTLVLFTSSSGSDGHFNKLTVREFELVDKTNTTRASVKVEETGEVVFRMRDGKGTIRVKIGAGEDGSGMVLLDQNTNPGIHALSGTTGIKFTITDKDGKKREL